MKWFEKDLRKIVKNGYWSHFTLRILNNMDSTKVVKITTEGIL